MAEILSIRLKTLFDQSIKVVNIFQSPPAFFLNTKVDIGIFVPSLAKTGKDFDRLSM